MMAQVWALIALLGAGYVGIMSLMWTLHRDLSDLKSEIKAHGVRLDVIERHLPRPRPMRPSSAAQGPQLT
jgi:hypothetical protein